MSLRDVIIYAVVGSFLGIVVGGLLVLWIMKKCFFNNKPTTHIQIPNSACLPNNNNDKNEDIEKSPMATSTVSVNSNSSKKPLLSSYGSTTRSTSTDSLPLNLGSDQQAVHNQVPTHSNGSSSSGAGNQGYRRSTNSSLEYCSQLSTDSETHNPTTRTKSGSITDVRPIGSIRPDLYTRKGSMFMQGVHKDPVIGRMYLKLKYDFKRSDLVVTLLQAREVSSSITECYLKVFLSDEPLAKIKQSKFVRRRLMHFEFNEEFKFPITFDELTDRTLMVQFYEHNASAKSNKSNVLLGAVNLDLQQVDPSADIEIIADIDPIKTDDDCLGEILLHLTYLPSVERLSLTIVKSKLKNVSNSDDSEYFVKVNVLLSGKTWKKKKTGPVKRRTNNINLIEWNEELSFRCLETKLKETQVDVVLFHKHPKEEVDVIGRVILAVDAPTSNGKFHWNEMLKNKGTLTVWHTLQYCSLTNRRRYSD